MRWCERCASVNKGRRRSWNISQEVVEELKEANKQVTQVKDKTRIQAALLAAQGILNLEQIAQSVGCARSSVQNWLQKLHTGGLSSLLQRGKAAGNPPALNKEQQKLLQQELARGQHRTAKQIGRWIQQQWGLQLQDSAVYYWLGKLAAVLRVAKPQHREHNTQAVKRRPKNHAPQRATPRIHRSFPPFTLP